MFVCPKCGKILVSKQAFTYHMNRKRPCIERFDCECTAQFKTKFDLYIHKINCNIQKNVTEHTCMHLTTKAEPCVLVFEGENIKEVRVMEKTFTEFQVKKSDCMI